MRRILGRQRRAAAVRLTAVGRVVMIRGVVLLHWMRARVQLRELGVLGRVQRGLGVGAGRAGRGRRHRALKGAVDGRGEDAERNEGKDDKHVFGLHARRGGGRRGRVLCGWERGGHEET